MLLVAWAGVVPAGAQTTAAVTVFDLSWGVRAAGMGGAFAGLADDEQAVLFNPAGLALLDGIHAHGVFESHLGLATVGSLMGALPAFGGGLSFYNVGGLVRRDSDDDEGEPFGYGQTAVLGAGAIRLGSFIRAAALENLGLGLRFKFLSVNTLAAGSGATFALDPSALWDLGRLRLGGINVEALRVGLALDNLGPGLSYGSGHEEALPLVLRLGSSFEIAPVTTALELNTADGLHLGAEYALPVAGAGELALRTGFFTRNGVTFALGLGFTFQQTFRVDYAFTTLPLGGAHRLALALVF